MKKAIKIVTIIFIFIALITASAAAFVLYKDKECGDTRIPESLSATATVQKYFEFWNEGNNRGMRMLTVDGWGQPGSSGEDAAVQTDGAQGDKNYIPMLDFFCRISCSKCVLLEERAENYSDYFDDAIVSVDFTYSDPLGWSDRDIPASCEGWEFHLIKESEDTVWKIISVERS